VVEGPPEDLVVHAARWETAGLLRSHTGEALAAFGPTSSSSPHAPGEGGRRPGAGADSDSPTSRPRSPSSRRGASRSPSC
jgi:hypothetical protein